MKNLAIEYPARAMALVDIGAPPVPGPTQVLLETLYSGVTNGTERHALMCDHGYGGGAYPSRHGYQHVCRVAAAGAEVEALREGEVVFLGEYVGHVGWHLREAVESLPLVVRLPARGDLSQYALLGVAGVPMRALRRTRVCHGQRVLVMGIGPIGIFAAQCAVALGAQVTVGDVVERRLEAARETGVQCVVDMQDEDAWGRVESGGPYQVIFDGAGYERFFFDVRDHGLLAYQGAIAAISVRGDTTFPWGMLHTTEASIEVSCHFSPDDLQQVLAFMAAGTVQVDPVVSHRVSIEEAPAVYATMRDDPRALFGVVFDWK